MPQARLEEAALVTHIENHCVRDRSGVEITEMC
jgi:hypothetical protein